jgi:hypothetical protein
MPNPRFYTFLDFMPFEGPHKDVKLWVNGIKHKGYYNVPQVLRT